MVTPAPCMPFEAFTGSTATSPCATLVGSTSVESARMPDAGLQTAVRDFTQRYSHPLGVRRVEIGDYAGQPCLVALAEEGFDRASLPASFMGFPVLVNDGTHRYPAEGPASP